MTLFRVLMLTVGHDSLMCACVCVCVVDEDGAGEMKDESVSNH